MLQMIRFLRSVDSYARGEEAAVTNDLADRYVNSGFAVGIEKEPQVLSTIHGRKVTIHQMGVTIRQATIVFDQEAATLQVTGGGSTYDFTDASLGHQLANRSAYEGVNEAGQTVTIVATRGGCGCGS
jgi:hypothetical protein